MVSSAQKQGLTQELASHRPRTASTPRSVFHGAAGMTRIAKQTYRVSATSTWQVQRKDKMGFDKTQPLDPQVALLQKLRDLRRQEDEEDVESTAARTRWLDAVEGLLVALRSWLQPAAAEGLARVDAASVHVADDDVGAYDAPALKIAFPGSKILWVRPVGTLRVGGQGI